MTTLFWVLIAIISAEFAGYLLHRLLHSGKIDYLSRSHMIHHMRIYGPKMDMLATEYRLSVKHRPSFLGVGLEWIAPGLVLYAVIIIFLAILSVPWQYVLLLVAVSFAYIYAFYNYLHDAMHIDGFWLQKTPLDAWFLRRRGWHFLHHTELSDDGRMKNNFGITFVILDRVFGTFADRAEKFNEKGFMAAERRYASVLDDFDRQHPRADVV
ncbi:sterol desaturase family protein [Candidatus Uhrbacteria bacterium]|nr:sterol desaturase family protein [Candidatus Uhrbacteria bacterium]